ncbi:1,4-beta-xylanase, partial [Streptomyces sp. FL07-04A]|nr:1,4-beta-xylanase [Streptomyces sp. FL07-04A]
MSRVLTRLAAILVALGLFLTSQSLTTPQQAAAADPGYLMVHFTGEGATNQQMYLSHST